MFYLDRHVSTQCVDYQTCSLHVSALRDGMCAHFLTYEVMSMCNFKHITLCLSHNFPQVYSKQSTTSRLFLTYEPFSLCNFWLTRMSPCANCHIRGRVCLQLVTQFLMFYLDYHVSTQMRRLRDAFMRVQILTHEPMSVCSFEHNFSFLRLMRRVSTSCINCEAWQCAIFH